MATKLECFILHHSEVVLTLVLLYSHAHSTEKHIFHKFLTRQITHRSHHSALVILILFTPIKKKKKRTVKHRLSRNYFPQLHSLPMLSMQRPSSERQSLALCEVLGRVMTPIAWHSPSAGSCLPAEMPPWSPAWLSLPQLQQSPHCQTGAALHTPCWPREPLPHVAVCSADAV